jgi:nicotinate-nucleotide adenylyltransferase
VIGIFGGAFDPPHNGHVAVVSAAKEELGLERVLVAVSADPGHKRVETSAGVRLALARLAFPTDSVFLDEHPRTIDLLRDHPEWHDPVFLIGADQFENFPSWKEPDEVLRLARLGVAMRAGYPRERLQATLERLEQPDRVLFFDVDEPAASHDLRARFDPATVPPAVAELVGREGFYGQPRGYTEAS